MNSLNQCVIIGGGSSIKTGIDSDLWERLDNRFVININWSYKHFTGTFLTCIDDNDFYFDQRCADIKSLPLILSLDSNTGRTYYDNTILLKDSGNYLGKDSFKRGIYCGVLTGMWAITIAIQLLKEHGEIFLLGYDASKITGATHYYDIKHRGIGDTHFYDAENLANYFKPFVTEQNIKIYNVSLESRIHNFEKISYEKFYTLLDDKIYDQDELRSYIREEINNARSC
jgi:hypothetical protein